MNPTTAKEKAQALAAELKQKQRQQDTFKAPTPQHLVKKNYPQKKRVQLVELLLLEQEDLTKERIVDLIIHLHLHLKEREREVEHL